MKIAARIFSSFYCDNDDDMKTTSTIHIAQSSNVPLGNEGTRTTPEDTSAAVNDCPGASTRERKNRTKRAKKVVSPDVVIAKKKVNSDVDSFYTKFVRNKKPSPVVVVDIGGSHVGYDGFRDSFRPRGDLSDEVMAALAEKSNKDAKEIASENLSCSKFTFSPYHSRKLFKDPASFEKNACVREISKFQKETNLSNIDLMHLPFVSGNHWVVACINNLFNTLNFFDSFDMTTEKYEITYLKNMVTNLHIVFKELNIHCRDFQSYNRFSPAFYPQQKTLHDCGFFVNLYVEHWDGKVMKDFSKVVMLVYRMDMAYELFHSQHNNIKSDPVVESKKRKRI